MNIKRIILKIKRFPSKLVNRVILKIRRIQYGAIIARVQLLLKMYHRMQ